MDAVVATNADHITQADYSREIRIQWYQAILKNLAAVGTITELRSEKTGDWTQWAQKDAV